MKENNMKFRFLTLLTVLVIFIAGCSAYGGGWIDSSTGTGKATFGFAVNCTAIDPHNILFTGQVQYNDPAAGVKFHGEIEQPYTVSSTEISCDGLFVVNNPTFIGNYVMEPSGKTGGFTWTVTDYGEPGPSEGDTVLVRLYDGPAYQSAPFYAHGGEIGGGNIQILP
jgi:hypothetical protein